MWLAIAAIVAILGALVGADRFLIAWRESIQPTGEAQWIYDLREDSGETVNMRALPGSPIIEADLIELMQTVRKRLLETDVTLQLSPAERARLKALGYAGED